MSLVSHATADKLSMALAPGRRGPALWVIAEFDPLEPQPRRFYV